MKILISLLFFILANSSFADEDMRYYDVEVIIIENLSEIQRNSENWPLQANLTPPEKTVQLGQPFSNEWLPQDVDLKSSYKLLKARNFQLKDVLEKISKSKTQRVIFHTAWRQPGLNKNLALPVYFKREIPAPPVIEDKNKLLTQDFEETSSLDSQKRKTSPSILEGILRVTLSRYLHLEAELTYRNKIPEISHSENPFTVLDNESIRNELQKQGVIYLKQKRRRIRSNELHYLDHPVLGILVRITPYKKPEVVVKSK